MRLRFSLSAVPLLLILSALAQAQGLGKILGTVSDPSGGVVVSAKVTATDVAHGFTRTATTDSEGTYILDALRPSEYDVNVEAAGFPPITQKGVTVLADQTLTVNLKVQVGSLTEVVTVVDSSAQVDVSTATLK